MFGTRIGVKSSDDWDVASRQEVLHEPPIAYIRRIYDRVAPVYDQSYQDPVSRAENTFVFCVLVGILPLGRVLDFGCGTGLLLSWHRPPPDLYTGVDLSPGMLAEARRKYPEYDFCRGGVGWLRWAPPGSYDTVVALFGVPSYFRGDDAEEFLWRAHRVLRPGGRLVFMPYGPAHRGGKVLREQGVLDLRRRYSAGAARRRLVRAGFAIERLYGLTGPIARALSGRPRVAAALVGAEARTLGRIRPDGGTFLVAVARRA